MFGKVFIPIKLIFTPRQKVEGYLPPPFPYIRTYFDYTKHCIVYYVFPLNYLVQLYLFISYIWKKYQNKPSLTDKFVDKKVKNIQLLKEVK